MDPSETSRGAPGSSGMTSTDTVLAELLEVQKAILAELRLIRAGLSSMEKSMAGRPEFASTEPAPATHRAQSPNKTDRKDAPHALVQAIIARNRARAKAGGA